MIEIYNISNSGIFFIFSTKNLPITKYNELDIIKNIKK